LKIALCLSFQQVNSVPLFPAASKVAGKQPLENVLPLLHQKRAKGQLSESSREQPRKSAEVYIWNRADCRFAVHFICCSLHIAWSRFVMLWTKYLQSAGFFCIALAVNSVVPKRGATDCGVCCKILARQTK